jgi:Ca2+-binding RTX toxin-like protein
MDDTGGLATELVDAVFATTTRAGSVFVLSEGIDNLTMLGTTSFHATGNDAANVIRGNAGANSMSGAQGADVMWGGLGADTMVGGTGADTMNGGLGNDTYYVQALTDVVDETKDGSGDGDGTGGDDTTDAGGVDTVFIQQPTLTSYTLGNYVEKLTIGGLGNPADFTATGNGLANRMQNLSLQGNTLQGLSGIDTLLGGDGNDTLAGGNDADRLTGGNGADVFRFDNRSYLNVSNVVVVNGPDRILDFESGGVDKIQVSASGYATGLAPDEPIIPFDTCTGVDPDGSGPLPADTTADNGTEGTFLYNLKTG